jgi:hypothetical protein
MSSIGDLSGALEEIAIEAHPYKTLTREGYEINVNHLLLG